MEPSVGLPWSQAQTQRESQRVPPTTLIGFHQPWGTHAPGLPSAGAAQGCHSLPSSPGFAQAALLGARIRQDTDALCAETPRSLLVLQE